MNEKTDTILVEVAAEGRVVTFAGEDMPIDVLPGLRLNYGDDAIHVPNTIGNRRKIQSGDLRVIESKSTLAHTPTMPSTSAFETETPATK